MMSETHFNQGDQVEVTTSVHGGSTGPYYPATVLRPVIKDKARILVQYQTLTAHGGGPKPLREIVEVGNVRPMPPRELHRPFKVGDDVDAFREKGWYRGTVREILENSKYLVVLDGKADLEFERDHFDLRVHREWDDGSWVPPLPQELELQQKSSGVVKCRKITIKIKDKKETMGANYFGRGTLEDDDQEFEYEKFNLRLHREWDDRSSVPPLPEGQKSSGVVKCRKIRFKLKAKKETVRRNFENGTLVEVSSDEEGYKDAWYTATIVDYIGKDKFLVEYVSLVTDDRTQLLREEASSSHIRPCPPPLPPLVQFKVLQKVDAWYNEGWWEGSISKVLTGSKYVVYFSSTKEELEFKHSNLRLHQDWCNGHWVMDPCQDFYGL
ncbi:protein AGENET DOMAIN (AGD)-CONTAINING P1 isoform X1 [Rosa rugosa]|uniref:protein AGENET DOMAIN (AGD)-CONTAINING P1 isoform X1 n=1 Tax=Rosa rugosa TaxID=74645 RepID=UPI002B40A8A7|nr:protein AGENET DOMAIN (AGD)-CONTAINING P1 isoform X1 [Rosa rugosa]